MDNYHTGQDEGYRLVCALMIYLVSLNIFTAERHITAVKDAGLYARQMFLTSSGTRHDGAWIDGSVFTGDNIEINVNDSTIDVENSDDISAIAGHLALTNRYGQGTPFFGLIATG